MDIPELAPWGEISATRYLFSRTRANAVTQRPGTESRRTHERSLSSGSHPLKEPDFAGKMLA
jgi:hypothetical protein